MAKEDLKPVRTKEEAKQRGRRGGIASGKARRLKRSIRERLEALLSAKSEEADMDHADAIVLSLVKEATRGNVQAFIAIRDSVGEKPTDKLNSSIDGEMLIKWQP